MGLACLLVACGDDALPGDGDGDGSDTEPDTTITGGPSGDVALGSATFTFTSDSGTSFECKLDSAAFAACGCRDYARVDFMIGPEGEIYLLEINTLPGMKETSLLPMSARCTGLDFTALVRELVSPAIERFHAARKK